MRYLFFKKAVKWCKYNKRRVAAMNQKVSIGIQNFESIRKNNCFYIDKTYFIKEWWDCGDALP